MSDAKKVTKKVKAVEDDSEVNKKKVKRSDRTFAVKVTDKETDMKILNKTYKTKKEFKDAVLQLIEFHIDDHRIILESSSNE